NATTRTLCSGTCTRNRAVTMPRIWSRKSWPTISAISIVVIGRHRHSGRQRGQPRRQGRTVAHWWLSDRLNGGAGRRIQAVGRDDHSLREQLGELAWRAEHRTDAFGVFRRIPRFLVGRRHVVGVLGGALDTDDVSAEVGHVKP